MLNLFVVKVDGKYGFIDCNGDVKIKPYFKSVGKFSNGLAPVFEFGGKGGGYINDDGAFIIPPSFEEVSSFNDGLACVRISGKYGYINTHGDFVVEPRYDGASPYFEGFAAVEINGKYGFLNERGVLIVDSKWDFVFPYRNGIAAVEKKDCIGFVDEFGNIIIEPQFEWHSHSQFFCDSVAPVSKNGEWGLIGRDGIYKKTAKFVYIGSYLSNRSIYRETYESKLGYINDCGDRLTNGLYDECTNFSDGFACVKKGRTWYVLNRDFQEKKSFYCSSVDEFSEGVAVINKREKLGYMDVEGNVFVKPQYDDVKQFEHGLGQVHLGGRFGYVDRLGTYVWKLSE